MANNRSAAYVQRPGAYPPSPESRIRAEIRAVGGGGVLSNVNAVGDERSLVDQLRLQEEYDLRNAIKASEQAAAQPE